MYGKPANESFFIVIAGRFELRMPLSPGDIRDDIFGHVQAGDTVGEEAVFEQ